MAKVSIMNSDLSQIFQGADSVNNVYLLTNKEAEEIWKEYIDKTASSYFHLNDNSWLVKNEYNEIGEWLKYYNSGEYNKVGEILKGSYDWKFEDRIYFCFSKVICIESKWGQFIINWDKFLEIDDDCPIVINKSPKNNEALIFTPLGVMIHVRK